MSRLTLICLCLTAAFLSAECDAQQPRPDSGTTEKFANPKPGDTLPEWSNLPGIDGKTHSTADYSDAEVIVLCFTCNTCPYSTDYEQRLVELRKHIEAEQLPVTLIAVNPNLVEADSLEAMQSRARDRNFNFPYLKDTTQSVARSYGAVYTPEFYVMTRDRRLVYRGAFDDSTDPEKVQRQYVREAVEAALNGRSPEISQSPAIGCAVRYKRGRR